jgi:hypothetical protein
MPSGKIQGRLSQRRYHLEQRHIRHPEIADSGLQAAFIPLPSAMSNEVSLAMLTLEDRDIHCLPRMLGRIVSSLETLDWSHGLTRDDLRTQIPTFPLTVYLRLPAAKRFASPRVVCWMALSALARANGEFVPVADVIQGLDRSDWPMWEGATPDTVLAWDGDSTTDFLRRLLADMGQQDVADQAPPQVTTRSVA